MSCVPVFSWQPSTSIICSTSKTIQCISIAPQESVELQLFCLFTFACSKELSNGKIQLMLPSSSEHFTSIVIQIWGLFREWFRPILSFKVSKLIINLSSSKIHSLMNLKGLHFLRCMVRKESPYLQKDTLALKDLHIIQEKAQLWSHMSQNLNHLVLPKLKLRIIQRSWININLKLWQNRME